MTFPHWMQMLDAQNPTLSKDESKTRHLKTITQHVEEDDSSDLSSEPEEEEKVNKRGSRSRRQRLDPQSPGYEDGMAQGARIAQDCFNMVRQQMGTEWSRAASESGKERKRAVPLRPSDPEHKDACAMYTQKDFNPDSGYYPDNKKDSLPYKWEGNKFVPETKIMKAPTQTAFYKTGEGNAIPNIELKKHFRTRCLNCGMKGHSSNHKSCPLAKYGNIWDLCSTCEAGMHTKCLVHQDHLVPFLRERRRN